MDVNNTRSKGDIALVILCGLNIAIYDLSSKVYMKLIKNYTIKHLITPERAAARACRGAQRGPAGGNPPCRNRRARARSPDRPPIRNPKVSMALKVAIVV